MSELEIFKVDLDNPEEFKDLMIPLKANKLAHEMNTEFIRVMGKRGRKLTKQEETFSLVNFHVMSCEMAIRTPLVSAGYTGFGKSTMLKILVKYMTRKFTNGFGCIIAVEKLSQIDELEAELNEEFKVAYALRGSQTFNSYEEYKNQYEEQTKLPVLILTHKMLEVITQTSKLHEMAFWYNSRGQKQRRMLTLIDEKPTGLLKNVQLTPEKISRFAELVRGLGLKKNGNSYDSQFYFEVKRLADELNSCLTAPRGANEPKTFQVPPLNAFYSVSPELLTSWVSADMRNEDRDLLPAFQQIVKYGGTANVFESGTKVTLAVKGAYDLSFTNTVIFDGSANDSLDYRVIERNAFFPLVDKQATEKVHFKLFPQVDLSKRKLKESPTLRKNTAKLAQIVSQSHRRTLVIVFKEFYEEYAEELKEEVASGAVSLAYFNSLTATNQFADHDAILPLGTFRKDSATYFACSHLIHERVETYETAKRPHFRYKDEGTQAYMIGDLTETLKQAVGRVRPFYADEAKTVYLITSYPEIIANFQEDFTGATFEHWTPPVEIGRASSKERFIDWLHEFAEQTEGTKVKSKEIYEMVLEIGTTQWKKIKKDPDVSALMTELEVTFKGQSIVKLK